MQYINAINVNNEKDFILIIYNINYFIFESIKVVILN